MTRIKQPPKLSNMKKIIKIAEARKIAAANPQLDADYLLMGIDWLNKGDEGKAAFMASEMKAVALYLLTREIASTGLNFTCDAREVCYKVDCLLLAEAGYTRKLVNSETASLGNRILFGEMNMGLNHITLTACNPYV